MRARLAFYCCLIVGTAGVCLATVDSRWAVALGSILVGASIGVSNAVGDL